MKKVLALFLLIPVPVYAAADEVDSLLFSGFKTLAALLAVLGLILLLYHFARKGAGFLPGVKTGIIKVVEMRSLGPKKTICLVEVRGQEYLLGVGVQEITLISKISGGGSGSFDQALQGKIGENS